MSGLCLYLYLWEVSCSCYRVLVDGCIVKFIFLYDVKNDDGIWLFFIDFWEVYVKVGGYVYKWG